jgi:hypothetical protein
MYGGIGVLIFTALVHYLKSPSSKPQAPARYDTQMSIHRAILTYITLMGALGCMIAPDMSLKLFGGVSIRFVTYMYFSIP